MENQQAGHHANVASNDAGTPGARARRFGLAAILVVAASGGTLLATAGGASATADDHVLTVNGATYDSYKHSGDAIHWETPIPSLPLTATFGERE